MFIYRYIMCMPSDHHGLPEEQGELPAAAAAAGHQVASRHGYARMLYYSIPDYNVIYHVII